MRAVLLGPPGAGKGTQAVEIARTFGVPKISTGDLFRAHAAGGTPLGTEVRGYLSRGDLVPDSVTVAMLRDRIAADDARDGFLLDGFPRTAAQAEELEELLLAADVALDAALELVVDEDEVVRRLSGRRTCSACGASQLLVGSGDDTCAVCGGALVRRDDDAPETVRHRLAVYAAQTRPLVEHYRERGLLVSVPAGGPVAEVTERALDALRGAART